VLSLVENGQRKSTTEKNLQKGDRRAGEEEQKWGCQMEKGSGLQKGK